MWRRLMMWLGYYPATINWLSIKPTGEDTYDVRFQYVRRWWATDEDVAVLKSQVILFAAERLGKRVKLVSPMIDEVRDE